MMTTADATKKQALAPQINAFRQKPVVSGSRARFLGACACESLDYAPIWLMRQAGRALPEYRALKEKYTFLELVRTPELATEVTLQPIRRFGFDAAILFSDILVVPEAMGQGYHFRDAGGVSMDFPINSEKEIEQLRIDAIPEKLAYVPAALKLIKSELNGKHALIGFAGSPWTLANFMLEGGSAKEPKKSLELLRTRPDLFKRLVEKLTVAVIDFLRLQIRAGVDAVQIFDSHGGLLPPKLFRAGSGLWIERIVRALNKEIPVIVFSKGARAWKELASTGANVIGIDHGVSMREAIANLPETLALQGNLDPGLLVGEPALVATEARRLMKDMEGRPGWIFNLGHGLPPAANLDSIYTLIETIRSR